MLEWEGILFIVSTLYMFQYIKTHLSRRQFRLLILLLFVASEYSFLVVPGTFATGVEQILVSSNISPLSNVDGWIVMPTPPQTPAIPRSSRTVTFPVTPTSQVSQTQKQTSNADGWLTSNRDISPGYKATQSKNTTPANTTQSYNSAPSISTIPSFPTGTQMIIASSGPYISSPISQVQYGLGTIPGNSNGNQAVNGTQTVNGNQTVNWDITTNGSSATTGNVTVGGNQTISGTTTTTNLVIKNGIGTPTELLGRDGSGSVNRIAIGTWLTLSGGILTADASGTISNSSNIAILSGSLSDLSGVVATKIALINLSATGGISYNSGTGLFSWNGTTDRVIEGVTNLYYTTARFVADFTARFQSAFDTAFGLKTTDNLAEWTGSLYFTNQRVQNAMSGTVNSLSGRISTVEQNVAANLSGSITNTNADVTALSGRVMVTETNITTLSGKLTQAALINTLSGASMVLSGVTSESANITGTGIIARLVATIANIPTLISNSITAVTANLTNIIASIINADTATIGTLTTGNLTSTGTATFNLANFLGNVVFNNLPSFPLSRGSLLVGSNTNKASELSAGGSGQVLIILNGTPVWTDASTVAPVISLFGRTGSVVAKTGDYTTSQVTESGSLYFTNSRARASISATGVVTYDSANGVIGWNGTTDNVPEGGTNLYYTESRFSGSLATQKNIANGIAWLDVNAKVSIMNLPGITMNSVWTATNKADCTTKISATRGDICIATSDSKSYILSTTHYELQADWQELLNPAAPVSQVNGQVGNINFVGTNGVTVSGTTISLTNVGTGGLYGSATKIPVITTDAQGRVTSVTETTIPTATAWQLGLLSPSDYVRFDAKQDLIATGSTAQYYRWDKTWANLDTSVVWENGNLYFTVARVRTALSATGAIIYNSSTGEFGDAFLFGSGLTRTGNSIGISSVTGAQLSGFTTGQLTFGTASGGLTSTGGLFWDNINGRLGIGTSAPQAGFHFISTSTIPWFRISGRAIDNSNDISGGVVFGMMHNDSTGNRQMVFWRTDDIGSASNGFIRFIWGTVPSLDAVTWNGSTRLKIQLWVAGDPSSWVYSADLGVNGKVGIGSAYYNSATLPANWLAVQGNVGIWTSSPNSKLEIDNTTANTSGLRFTRLTSTGASSSLFSGILGVNSTGDVGITQLTGNSLTGFTAGQLTFGTSTGWLTQSSNLFWDNTNGRLGINTASPTERIEVNGNIRSNGIISAVNTGTTNVFSLDSMDAVWPKLKMGTIWTPGWYFEIGAYNSQNNFDTKTRDLQFFWTSGNSIGIMMKAITGNVGIWTSSPSMKLQVNGDIWFGANAQYLRWFNSSGTGTRLFGINAANDLYIGGIDATIGSTLFVNNGIERMRINAVGNIGIWTSSPNSKLEIDNTTANTSGLRFTRLTSTGASSSLFSGILGVNSTGDVGITQLTGNSLTGFTAGQLTFGTSTGWLTQSSNLFWDNTNSIFTVTNNNQAVASFNSINNASSSYVAVAHFMAPNNTTAGNASQLRFGVNTGTNYNSAEWRYIYQGNGSNQNRIDFGFIGIPNPVMSYRGDGNVGIWTSSPNVRLEIDSGVANASGFRFTRMSWSGTSLLAGTASWNTTRAIGINSTGDVYITNWLGSLDSRSIDYSPSDRPAWFYIDFKNNSTNWLNDGGLYNWVMTFRSYWFGTDLSWWKPMQISYTENWNLYTRLGTWATNWDTWRKLLVENSSGNVGIWTSSPSTRLSIRTSSDTAGTQIENFESTTGSVVGSITRTAWGVAYNTTSDMRLKHDIVDTEFSLQKLLSIKVRDYIYNADSTNIKQTGFIAQELYDILPNVVTRGGADATRNPWTIDYGAITPYLTKAIQELAQNTASTGAINTLSWQVQALSWQVALLSQSSGSISNTTVVNNYISSGSVSGLIMSGTGQASTDALSTVQAETPRSALSYITDMFTHAFEVVRDFVVLEITAVRGYFDQIFARTTHTETLCIGTAGNETCITKTQLDALLAGTAQSNTPAPIVPPSSSSGSDSSSGSSSGSSIPPVPTPVLGCIDNTASNYSAIATQDDGSCTAPAVVPSAPIAPIDPATGTGS
jgi:Chaperone of endosialidase